MAGIAPNTGYGILNPGTTLPVGQSTSYSPYSAGTSSIPGSPAGLINSPIPGISNYMGADANALKAYNDALSQITYNRQQLLSQNGYLADIDPKSGVTRNLRVDPHSMYGGYQMMLGNQALADESAVDDANGRGLYGGLAHQAGNQLRFQHGAEDNAFGQNLMGGLQGLLSQQQSAYNTYQNVLWQDKLAAMMAAIANGQWNPGSSSTPGTDAALGGQYIGGYGPNTMTSPRGTTPLPMGGYNRRGTTIGGKI